MHIPIKLLKTKDKKKIFKAALQKDALHREAKEC